MQAQLVLDWLRKEGISEKWHTGENLFDNMLLNALCREAEKSDPDWKKLKINLCADSIMVQETSYT